MKVETNPNVLQRQQLVLAHLGYYSGKIDGIWSSETIKAKRDFETSGKFNPGIPNRGLPFVLGLSLPKTVFADPFERGLLTCKGLDKDTISKLLKERGEHTGNAISVDTEKVNTVDTEKVDTVDTKEVKDPAKESTSEAETPEDTPVQHVQKKKPKHSNQRHRHHN